MLLRRTSAARPNRLPPVVLVSTGLVLIVAGLLWPSVTALRGRVSDNGVDFIQGVTMGIGIACEVLGVAGILARRRKRAESDRS